MTISDKPDFRPFEGPEHLPFQLGGGPGGILLVHGFGGTPAEMRGLGDTLARAGWHVRSLLLPGFGPDIINLDKHNPQDWFEAVRREWESMRQVCDPCVLLGFSLGGAIALNLEARLLPSRLILIAPFWQLPDWIRRSLAVLRWVKPKIYPFRKANFSDPRLHQFVESLLPGINLADPVMQDYVRNELYIPVHTIYEILQSGRQAYKLARKLKTPTLVIQGQQDSVVAPKATRRLVDQMPAELLDYRLVPGEHHLLPDLLLEEDSTIQMHTIQNPVVDIILDWLPSLASLLAITHQQAVQAMVD